MISRFGTSTLTTALLAAALSALAAYPAAANVLAKPVPPEPEVGRFRLGAFATFWEFSPASGSLNFRSDTLDQQADPGFLISGQYAVSRRLSIGAWYNRLGGSYDERGGRSILTYDADYWDAHLLYQLSPRYGWSVQAGVSGTHFNLRPETGIGGSRGGSESFFFYSPNIWVTKSQRIAAPCVAGRRYPITLFGSLGWFTSGDFARALNGIAGVSVDLNSRIQLNATYWVNDFDAPNTRITAGLVGVF